MCQDFSVLTEDEILQLSCGNWQSQGQWTSDGQFWTRNGLEYRNVAAACSLSQILQDDVPPKYFLSAKACAGILRRAAKRGKALPPHLEAALQAVASQTLTEGEKTIPTLSLPQPSERQVSARKGRATRAAKTA